MNDTTKKRRRTWLIVLLVAAPCASLYALSLDDSPPDDSDLRAREPLADNAYAELRALYEEDFVAPNTAVEEAASSWFGDDETFPLSTFARYVAENAAVFDRVKVLVRDRPTRAPSAAVSDISYDFLQLARWMANRARVLVRQGKSRQAFEEALAVVALGGRIEADALSTLDWGIGICCRRHGIEAFEDVLAHSELTEEELAALDRSLAAVPELRGLPDALRGDYLFWGLPIFERASAPGADFGFGDEEPIANKAMYFMGSPLEGLVYKPNRTRARYAELLRLQSRALEDEGAASVVIERWPDFEEMATTNVVGRALLRGCSRDRDQLEGLRQQRRLSELELEALRTLVALRRFRLEEGRWPKSLEELRPRFLKSIPRDLDGQPLRYRPAGELVYSVGKDLQDDLATDADRIFSFRCAKGL